MQRIHDIKCVASKHSVDLLMHGFCFRLKVYYDKDSTLVQKRKIKADNPIRELTHLPEKEKDFLHILKNDLLLNSLHASMLSGLQGRFPIYGPTVR
jgi:U3 small nucleolar RNA-associated protein 22